MVEGREIYDRLLYSGRVLFDFDVYNWFGLEVSRAQTFDSGYGYVISNVGIIGFIALWILFMSLAGIEPVFLFLSQRHGSLFHDAALHLGVAIHHQDRRAALVSAGSAVRAEANRCRSVLRHPTKSGGELTGGTALA